MEKIKAIYESRDGSGCGYYPEDDWEESCVVNNPNELFEFLKWIHIRDSRNRNNYPILSFIDPNRMKFNLVKIQECNLGHMHNTLFNRLRAFRLAKTDLV